MDRKRRYDLSPKGKQTRRNYSLTSEGKYSQMLRDFRYKMNQKIQKIARLEAELERITR